MPSDRLVQRVAQGLLDGGALREHLTRGIFLPPHDELGLGLLEGTLEKVVRAQEVHTRIRTAVRDRRLEKKPKATLVERALEAKLISEADHALVEEAEAARQGAIAVDSFSRRAYAELSA